MADPTIAARHAALCGLIHAQNHAYYVLNRPVMTDREYDALLQELKDLEAAAPELVTPDSPTQRVGAPLPSESRFEKVTRAVPMLSLDNSYNPKDIITFEKSVRQFLRPSDATGDSFKGDLEFIIEPKLDGVSIECVYEQGRLKLAATRGDGITGENVTVNIAAIDSVPKTLAEPLDLTVRGEIFLRFADFEALNRRRQAEGLEPLVNPRNAVGGAIHQLELHKKAARAARQLTLFDAAEPADEKPNPITGLNLSAVFYEVAGGLQKATQVANLKFLEGLGFSVPQEPALAASVEEILAVIARWDEKRLQSGFPMDGLVIKVNDCALWKLLGRSAKSPRWAIAYKFKAERVSSRLVSVDAQVGRTGIITPVANVEPVFLGGTTVSRASLHNWSYVRKKKLRIGDSVWVEKAGEIIPQIMEVDETRDRGSELVEPPTVCPSCGTELLKESLITRKKKARDEEPEAGPEAEPVLEIDDGEDAFLTCPNEEGCRARLTARIIHFVSRGAMNIDSLGEMIVTRLVEAGFVGSPVDLYRLGETQLYAIEGFAEKSVTGLLASIEKSRSATLSRFIFGMGIPSVGIVNARLLAGHFRTLGRLVEFARSDRSARSAAIREISGLGEKLQEEIVDYFERPWVVRILVELSGLGLDFSEPDSGRKPLLGKVFCITGTLQRVRSEVVAMIQEQGGVTRVSPSRNCDYFVEGANPTPKKVQLYETLKNDKKSDIRRLSEAELIRLLRGEEL